MQGESIKRGAISEQWPAKAKGDWDTGCCVGEAQDHRAVTRKSCQGLVFNELLHIPAVWEGHKELQTELEGR